MLEQNINIFTGRDAAEQDNFAIDRQLPCEFPHVAHERCPVARIILIDINLREVTQFLNPICTLAGKRPRFGVITRTVSPVAVGVANAFA